MYLQIFCGKVDFRQYILSPCSTKQLKFDVNCSVHLNLFQHEVPATHFFRGWWFIQAWSVYYNLVKNEQPQWCSVFSWFWRQHVGSYFLYWRITNYQKQSRKPKVVAKRKRMRLRVGGRPFHLGHLWHYYSDSLFFFLLFIPVLVSGHLCEGVKQCHIFVLVCSPRQLFITLNMYKLRRSETALLIQRRIVIPHALVHTDWKWDDV